MGVEKVGIKYSGIIEECELGGTYVDCDFSQLSMRDVILSGIFVGCQFTPEDGITREEVQWWGKFVDCEGVG